MISSDLTFVAPNNKMVLIIENVTFMNQALIVTNGNILIREPIQLKFVSNPGVNICLQRG